MNRHIGPEERRQIELIKGVKARLANPPKRRKVLKAPCPKLEFVDMTTGVRIIFLDDHNAHCITRYKFLLGENDIDHTGPSEIIDRISKRTGVSIAEMKGSRRFKKITAARQLAMATVATECQHLSLPQIGRIFRKDHTTVLHAMNKLGMTRTQTYHKNKAA